MNKLGQEIRKMTKSCHVIFMQEISSAWCKTLETLLPAGWVLKRSTQGVAIIFKKSDWQDRPEDSTDNEHRMFPNTEDNNNAHRHWRTFLTASQVVGAIKSLLLIALGFLSDV